MNFLNTGQTPVVAFDQSLFAIANNNTVALSRLLWSPCNGDGPTATEMAFMAAIRKVMKDGGWCALCSAH